MFRGFDSDGRTTTLVLSGDFDTIDGKRRMTPTTLRLSYALDPKNPDVFRLDRGAFSIRFQNNGYMNISIPDAE